MVYILSMAELLNRIRQAIAASGQTRYRISQETGIAQSQLSRLMSREAGVSIDTAERLAKYLGLEIVIRRRTRTKTRKGKPDGS